MLAASDVPDDLLLVGFGLTNRAVAAALGRRDRSARAVDDRPTDEARAAAAAIGIELIETPDPRRLRALVEEAGGVVPAPGLPDAHPVFALAAELDRPVFTEFDLAGAWDRRPIVAITGTDGKTTVTTMVTDMLRAAGIPCVDAGNNDLPLVVAIDDPAPEWFVVEASSFRLGRTHRWAPRVATWLNLAPDHLDVHATIDGYVAAKAKVWSAQGPDDVAIGNLDDDVVRAHLVAARGRQVGYSIERPADYSVIGQPCGSGTLQGPEGVILAVDELPRALPHDIANALAAAATAAAAGVPTEVIAAELRRSRALPHRVEFVATISGVTYHDDSKATVPHATLAAVRGFPSVVLIAGGRNKGLDLGALAEAADRIRAVVAIGDAASEVEAAFGGLRPVVRADSMAEAVTAASGLARHGDTVLLSPACASFDWYPNYAARGDDFAAHVRALEEQT